MSIIARSISVGVLGCAITAVVSAQFSMTPTVLANCGGEGDSLAYKMEWTLGEFAIESLGNGMLHLTQGFHQPFLVPVEQGVGVDEVTIENPATIWPNPTEEELNLTFGSPLRGEVNADVIGLDGRFIHNHTLKPGTSRAAIPVADLAAGGYLLVLTPADASNPTVHRFIRIIQ